MYYFLGEISGKINLFGGAAQREALYARLLALFPTGFQADVKDLLHVLQPSHHKVDLQFQALVGERADFERLLNDVEFDPFAYLRYAHDYYTVLEGSALPVDEKVYRQAEIRKRQEERVQFRSRQCQTIHLAELALAPPPPEGQLQSELNALLPLSPERDLSTHIRILHADGRDQSEQFRAEIKQFARLVVWLESNHFNLIAARLRANQHPSTFSPLSFASVVAHLESFCALLCSKKETASFAYVDEGLSACPEGVHEALYGLQAQLEVSEGVYLQTYLKEAMVRAVGPLLEGQFKQAWNYHTHVDMARPLAYIGSHPEAYYRVDSSRLPFFPYEEAIGSRIAFLFAEMLLGKQQLILRLIGAYTDRLSPQADSFTALNLLERELREMRYPLPVSGIEGVLSVLSDLPVEACRAWASCLKEQLEGDEAVLSDSEQGLLAWIRGETSPFVRHAYFIRQSSWNQIETGYGLAAVLTGLRNGQAMSLHQNELILRGLKRFKLLERVATARQAQAVLAALEGLVGVEWDALRQTLQQRFDYGFWLDRDLPLNPDAAKVKVADFFARFLVPTDGLMMTVLRFLTEASSPDEALWAEWEKLLEAPDGLYFIHKVVENMRPQEQAAILSERILARRAHQPSLFRKLITHPLLSEWFIGGRLLCDEDELYGHRIESFQSSALWVSLESAVNVEKRGVDEYLRELSDLWDAPGSLNFWLVYLKNAGQDDLVNCLFYQFCHKPAYSYRNLQAVLEDFYACSQIAQPARENYPQGISWIRHCHVTHRNQKCYLAAIRSLQVQTSALADEETLINWLIQEWQLGERHVLCDWDEATLKVLHAWAINTSAPVRSKIAEWMRLIRAEILIADPGLMSWVTRIERACAIWGEVEVDERVSVICQALYYISARPIHRVADFERYLAGSQEVINHYFANPCIMKLAEDLDIMAFQLNLLHLLRVNYPVLALLFQAHLQATVMEFHQVGEQLLALADIPPDLQGILFVAMVNQADFWSVWPRSGDCRSFFESLATWPQKSQEEALRILFAHPLFWYSMCKPEQFFRMIQDTYFLEIPSQKRILSALLNQEAFGLVMRPIQQIKIFDRLASPLREQVMMQVWSSAGFWSGLSSPKKLAKLLHKLVGDGRSFFVRHYHGLSGFLGCSQVAQVIANEEGLRKFIAHLAKPVMLRYGVVGLLDSHELSALLPKRHIIMLEAVCLVPCVAVRVAAMQGFMHYFESFIVVLRLISDLQLEDARVNGVAALLVDAKNEIGEFLDVRLSTARRMRILAALCQSPDFCQRLSQQEGLQAVLAGMSLWGPEEQITGLTLLIEKAGCDAVGVRDQLLSQLQQLTDPNHPLRLQFERALHAERSPINQLFRASSLPFFEQALAAAERLAAETTLVIDARPLEFDAACRK